MSAPVAVVLGVSVGHFVRHTYNAGYIILSFLVSFSGAWTTLELLHRRTSSRGLYNWYLLLAAASSMGAVSIWSMHFIGNRAIQMANGEPSLQIEYSPGFTAASFFLPICVVGFSFYLFTMVEKVHVVTTLMGGSFTGAAVCGMHYMGQGGIVNYTPKYGLGYVVGSAIIAVVASTVALGVFFYLTSTWINSWLKRMACAALLAISVSGMHWVATVGTTYRLKKGTASPNNGWSRQATVVVVLCLALGCCVVLFVLAWLGQWSRRRAAERAEQVSLACAIFDPDGKMMVTTGGRLPCCKITNSSAPQSFDDVFNVEHPVFCWIYRASRCWKDITNMIPAIREDAQDQSNRMQFRTGNRRRARLGRNSPRSLLGTQFSSGDTEEYSKLFKKLFLAAASDLAEMIQEPLQNVGLLSEDIMKTGTLRRGTQTLFSGMRNFFSRSSSFSLLEHEERGSSTDASSRGQLLFLTRRATRADCVDFQAAGFRFASITHIIEPLARSIEVTQSQLLPRLERMQVEAGKSHMLGRGIHVAFFAVRPVYQRGFEVLARSDAKNMLPTAQLPLPALSKLSSWHTGLLSLFNNMTVDDCLRAIVARVEERNHFLEAEFLNSVFLAIHQIFDNIPEQLAADARLMPQILRAPCRGPVNNPELGMADMIVFTTIADIHHNLLLHRDVEFVPWHLFKTQQHCFENAHDNTLFANRVRREYAELVTSHALRHASSFSSRSYSFSRPFSRQRTAPNTSRTTPAQVSSIEVTSEWIVDANGRPMISSQDIELRQLGNHVEAAVALPYMDRESWIDELMTETVQNRQRPDAVTRPLSVYRSARNMAG